jgi:hypothetical protein
MKDGKMWPISYRTGNQGHQTGVLRSVAAVLGWPGAHAGLYRVRSWDSASRKRSAGLSALRLESANAM